MMSSGDSYTQIPSLLIHLTVDSSVIKSLFLRPVLQSSYTEEGGEIKKPDMLVLQT